MTLANTRHRILATFTKKQLQKSCLNEVNLDFCCCYANSCAASHDSDAAKNPLSRGTFLVRSLVTKNE